MTYLVPMLLYASFCPLGECLVQATVSTSSLDRSSCDVDSPAEHTFAISLQLCPASRICFSLCSSAAVHGVFVRLFFAFGSGRGASASGAGAGAGAVVSVAPAVVGVFAIWSGGLLRLIDLRLRAPAGDGGWAAVAKESCGVVVAGCSLGSSAEGAS